MGTDCQSLNGRSKMWYRRVTNGSELPCIFDGFTVGRTSHIPCGKKRRRSETRFLLLSAAHSIHLFTDCQSLNGRSKMWYRRVTNELADKKNRRFIFVYLMVLPSRYDRPHIQYIYSQSLNGRSKMWYRRVANVSTCGTIPSLCECIL